MEFDTAILIPAGVLILWTMGVLIAMMVQRMRIFSQMKVDLGTSPPGKRGIDLERENPEIRDWAAHNYMHLMEQPTIFYAASALLAFGGYTGYDLVLCWLYVAIRMVHSVWQIRVNKVQPRAMIFLASSAVMLLIAVRALLSVL